jgi:hypothetical protein
MDILDVTDTNLENENNLYYELYSLFEYYIKKYYNYIVTFYELDSVSTVENQTKNETRDIVEIDETYLNKLCVTIGNSIIEDSYEIIYEENIDKEL